VIAVRGGDGSVAFYDLPRNVHQGGVLRESLVPAEVPESVRREAEATAKRIAEAFGYVGVIAVEMFLERMAEGGRLLVNEIAPRVHNSGHWTIEACAISQFENHIRAIAGWPLGATTRHSDARLVNLLGGEVDAALELMTADPARSLHLYGKRDARDGRKMGHYVELGSPAKS
jgi:5-(carboxyamino)imidazole ribonucleotide synthase